MFESQHRLCGSCLLVKVQIEWIQYDYIIIDIEEDKPMMQLEYSKLGVIIMCMFTWLLILYSTSSKKTMQVYLTTSNIIQYISTQANISDPLCNQMVD